MGKAKKIGIGVGIAVVAFFGLVIAAALTYNPTQADPAVTAVVTDASVTVPEKVPANSDKVFGIDEFSMIKKGTYYQGQLSFVDEYLSPIATDFKFELLIVQEENTYYNIDYKEKRFRLDVKASDFVDAQVVLTGADVGLTYFFVIEQSDLSEFDERVFGEAVLTVTLDDGRSFTADTTIIF